MPYKDKQKDRDWHRDRMRIRRGVTPVTPSRTGFVTPSVTPKMGYELQRQGLQVDADGNPIPD